MNILSQLATASVNGFLLAGHSLDTKFEVSYSLQKQYAPFSFIPPLAEHSLSVLTSQDDTSVLHEVVDRGTSEHLEVLVEIMKARREEPPDHVCKGMTPLFLVRILEPQVGLCVWH